MSLQSPRLRSTSGCAPSQRRFLQSSANPNGLLARVSGPDTYAPIAPSHPKGTTMLRLSCLACTFGALPPSAPKIRLQTRTRLDVSPTRQGKVSKMPPWTSKSSMGRPRLVDYVPPNTSRQARFLMVFRTAAATSTSRRFRVRPSLTISSRQGMPVTIAFSSIPAWSRSRRRKERQAASEPQLRV